MVYTGNETSYRKICKQLLSQPEKLSDRFMGSVTVRSCLVSPQPVADPEVLLRRAEKLLEGSKDWPGMPWVQAIDPPDAS